jgi:hypothetical protein
VALFGSLFFWYVARDSADIVYTRGKEECKYSMLQLKIAGSDKASPPSSLQKDKKAKQLRPPSKPIHALDLPVQHSPSTLSCNSPPLKVVTIS